MQKQRNPIIAMIACILTLCNQSNYAQAVAAPAVASPSSQASGVAEPILSGSAEKSVGILNSNQVHGQKTNTGNLNNSLKNSNAGKSSDAGRAGRLSANNVVVDLLMEGNDLLAEGEYDKSIKAFNKAMALAPEKAESYMGLGRISVLKGDRKKAISCFERACELNPKSAEAHFELGSSRLAQGELQEAIKELSLAYDLDPQRPEIQYRLSQARSLGEVSRLTPHKPAFESIETKQSRTGQGSSSASDSKTSASDDQTGASDSQTSASDSDRRKRSSEALGWHLRPSAGQNQFDNVTHTSELSLVYRLITGGRVQEAIEQAQTALKDQSDNTSLMYQLGLMYKVTGNSDKAVGIFEDLLQIDPKHTEALGQLSNLYLASNRIDKARQTTKRWVEADADNPYAHFSRAWTYIIVRDFNQAMPELKEAVQLDPRNPDLQNHLGLVLRELKKDREAKAAFERALALAPDAQAPRLNLAMYNVYDDKVEEAHQLLQPIVEKSPLTPHAEAVAALIDSRLGKLERARMEANEVLKRIPTHGLASLALANIAEQEDKLDEAARILAGVQSKLANSPLYWHAMAELQLRRGDAEQAVSFARRAYQLAPERFLTGETLVIALAKNKDGQGALDTLNEMRGQIDGPERLDKLKSEILDSTVDKAVSGKHKHHTHHFAVDASNQQQRQSGN